jgi:hypothetical protein
MITHHDFRYEHTLRLGFDNPLGTGSFGFETEEELKEFFNEYCTKDEKIETYKKCQKLEDQINEIFRESLEKIKFEKEIELDWRDAFEIEIHGIDQDKFNENIIQEMNSKLEMLVKETK